MLSSKGMKLGDLLSNVVKQIMNSFIVGSSLFLFLLSFYVY